jgi:hypothetical protein
VTPLAPARIRRRKRKDFAMTKEIVLGSLSVSGPLDVVAQAVMVAEELARIIREKKLSRSIQGREYVYVEGWTTLGAMLGVTPREVSVEITPDGDYLAAVELVRVVDSAVIGRGSALCGSDEQTWANRPRYARRSMAITRATGKAYRLAFSWVMKLAGYEPTPAEEIPDDFELAKPQKHEQAVVKTQNWAAIANRISESIPYYKRDGKPAIINILKAAAAEGFWEITDGNAEPLLEALSERVKRKKTSEEK